MSAIPKVSLPTGAWVDLLCLRLFDLFAMGGIVEDRLREAKDGGQDPVAALAEIIKEIVNTGESSEQEALAAWSCRRGESIPAELERLVPEGADRPVTLARLVGAITSLRKPEDRAVEPTRFAIHHCLLTCLVRALIGVWPPGREGSLLWNLCFGRKQYLEEQEVPCPQSLKDSAKQEFQEALHTVASERRLGEHSRKLTDTLLARVDRLDVPVRNEVDEKIRASSKAIYGTDMEQIILVEERKCRTDSGCSEKEANRIARRIVRQTEKIQVDVDFLKLDLVVCLMPRVLFTLLVLLFRGLSAKGARSACAAAGMACVPAEQGTRVERQEPLSPALQQADTEAPIQGENLPKESEKEAFEQDLSARPAATTEPCWVYRLLDTIQDIRSKLPEPLGGLMPFGLPARL